MKKSLFIAAALLYSGLGVQAATLKYYYDFNKPNGSLSSLNDNNLAGETAGTAAFSGGGWINYADGYEGKGYDSRSNGGQLTLGSADNGLGLNTEDGFSPSIAVKDYSPGQSQTTALWKGRLTRRGASRGGVAALMTTPGAINTFSPISPRFVSKIVTLQLMMVPLPMKICLP